MPDVRRAAPSARTTFAATMRSSRRSLSLKTSPMPPAPIRSIVWKPSKSGRVRPGESTAGVTASPSSAVVSERYRSTSARSGSARSGRPPHRSSSDSRSPCNTWCSTKRANRDSRSVPGPVIGRLPDIGVLSRRPARKPERERRHRAREQHPARVLALAEAPRDVAERQLFELPEQDDLAVRRRQRLERDLQALRFLRQDRLRQGAPRGRRERGVGLERHFARRVAPLPLLVVRAIADLVLRNLREPRHQRSAVLTFEVREVLDRLEQRRLEDVARLEPRPQLAAHPQPDVRQQPPGASLVQLVDRVGGPGLRALHEVCARRSLHARQLTTRFHHRASGVTSQRTSLSNRLRCPSNTEFTSARSLRERSGWV